MLDIFVELKVRVVSLLYIENCWTVIPLTFILASSENVKPLEAPCPEKTSSELFFAFMIKDVRDMPGYQMTILGLEDGLR
jgi:hypothetical protein